MKDGIRTRDPWNHNPITNTIQVPANKRLTKKPKSNSAIYLATTKQSECVFDIEKERAIKEICQILRTLPTEFCLSLIEHINKRKPDIAGEGFKSNGQKETAYDLYTKLKSKYSDCLLLFLWDNSYKAFFEDAKIVSAVLKLPLNSSLSESASFVEILYSSKHNSIKKLLEAGYKVALYEQVKDRDVIRIITPESFSEQNKP